MFWIVGDSLDVVQENAPFLLDVGGHFITDNTYCTERQHTDSYLLLYTLDGTGSLQYEGKTYPLNAGKLFLIDCRKHQIYRTEGECWEFLWVHFRAGADRQYVDTLLTRAGPVFDCMGDEIEKMFWGILHLLQNGVQHWVHEGFCMLANLLALLYRKSASDMVCPVLSPDTARVLDVIKTQFSQALTLDTLAMAVNRSKYYLCHKFKKEMGIGIYAYLTMFRLTRAKLLLRTTDLPVQVIAEQVGFESASNFIHAFSQSELVTPARYRKQWK